MTKDTSDKDSPHDVTPASPGVTTPHADDDSRDRRHLITKTAREIARRSAHLNERLR